MTFDPKTSTYIVYDGECPFCANHVKLVRLRQTLGKVTLINAREPNPAVDYVEEHGVVLDQEMALILDGKIYSGPE